MKTKMTFLTALACILTISSASAQTATQTSVQTAETQEPMTLRNQAYSLAPRLGVLGYYDAKNNYTTRGTVGMSAGWNAAHTVEIPSDFYLGLESGVLYSHPGSTDSNIVGGNGSASNGSGANVLIIPGDLKVGYNLTDHFRLSAYGGANVIYQSVGNTLSLGTATGNPTNENWTVYPNMGVDVELQLNNHFSVSARPDLTIAPNNDLFVATLGATYIGF